MRQLSYEDALDQVTEAIIKTYSESDLQKLAYDTVYSQLEKNHSMLVEKAEELDISIYDY